MGAVKPTRHGPSMDMTAMCDVAFLLLTFFIMTTSFKSQESVSINTPSSISELKVDEANISMVSIDPDGKLYFGILNPVERRGFAEELNKTFNIGLDNNEINKFTKLSEVGMPVKSLKQYLALSEGDRLRVKVEGIPCDSTNTELVKWIKAYGAINPKGSLAIRGDMKTQYKTIKVLFDQLGKADINKFKLVTKGEKG